MSVSARDPGVKNLRKRVEGDFYYFCTQVMGFDQFYEPLHRPICEWAAGVFDRPKRYSLLMIPRGHFKTTIGSVCFPIWCLAKNPNLRILIAHGKLGTAIAELRNIKTQIEVNDKLVWLWPDVFYRNPSKESSLWLSDQINVRRTYEDKVPSISTASPDASNTGFHYHLQIHDDLSTDVNSRSVTERQKVKFWVQEQNNTLRPADKIEPRGGRFMGLGTPWHYDDVWAMLRGPDYEDDVSQKVMGLYGEPGRDSGEPIFPTRFPEEEVERRKKKMSRSHFAAQMLCDPNPEGAAIFKRSDIMWFREGEQPEGMLFFASVDPNRSEKTQDDPMALVVAGRDYSGHLWVVDLWHGHPTGTQILDWIEQAVKRWKPQTVFIEDVQFQRQLVHWLRERFVEREISVPVTPLPRGPTSKFTRVTALEPLVEKNKLHIREGLEIIATELERFPQWRNDDTVDALADIYTHGWDPTEPTKPPPPKNPHTVSAILETLGERGSRAPVSWGRGFGGVRMR
jgi:phage terminase large subunit-like protein